MDSVESRKEHIVNLIDSQAGLCRGPLACRLSGIATKVEASFNGLLASGNLDVDVQNAAASTSSHVEARVHVFQNGSIDRTDQTMQEIMDKAHNFPPTVAGINAAAYAAIGCG
jgi:hypothetical protein